MVATCVTCTKPLVLDIDSDDDGNNGRTVPDAVELTCGCHFHWECLLDAYSMNECPNCGKDVTHTSSSGTQQTVCNLDNEGGVQEGIDILPLLVEASYLKAYPEDRKGRAFVEFAAEGDAMAMLGMLAEDDGDEEGDRQLQGTADTEIVRYQDPLGGMNSALHVAVVNDCEVVAWLVLLLASGLEDGVFPAEVVQRAQEMEILRPSLMGQVDIRSLRNSEGRTAAQLAKERGEFWTRWVDAGWLEP